MGEFSPWFPEGDEVGFVPLTFPAEIPEFNRDRSIGDLFLHPTPEQQRIQTSSPVSDSDSLYPSLSQDALALNPRLGDFLLLLKETHIDYLQILLNLSRPSSEVPLPSWLIPSDSFISAFSLLGRTQFELNPEARPHFHELFTQRFLQHIQAICQQCDKNNRSESKKHPPLFDVQYFLLLCGELVHAESRDYPRDFLLTGPQGQRLRSVEESETPAKPPTSFLTSTTSFPTPTDSPTLSFANEEVRVLGLSREVLHSEPTTQTTKHFHFDRPSSRYCLSNSDDFSANIPSTNPELNVSLDRPSFAAQEHSLFDASLPIPDEEPQNQNFAIRVFKHLNPSRERAVLREDLIAMLSKFENKNLSTLVSNKVDIGDHNRHIFFRKIEESFGSEIQWSEWADFILSFSSLEPPIDLLSPKLSMTSTSLELANRDLNTTLLPSQFQQQPSSQHRPHSAGPRIERDSRSMLHSSPSSRQDQIRSTRPKSAVLPRTIKAQSSQTFEKKILEVQNKVEDLVRSAVKQADLYHVLQVHLGFLSNHTFFPARGQVIKSVQRLWLSVRELHSAFISARVRLSEPQIYTLMKLVESFSKDYQLLHRDAQKHISIQSLPSDHVKKGEPSTPSTNRSMTPTKTSIRHAKIPPSDSELSEQLASQPVISKHNQLNSEWLRRYLLHLKLHQRSQTPSGWCSSTQERGESRTHTGVGPAPLLWEEWLCLKFGENNPSSKRPKEFRRALAGKRSTLSREEMESMLETHDIIPEEDLENEIRFRLEAWKLDIDGRREFKHAFNLEVFRLKKKNNRDIPPSPELTKKIHELLLVQKREDLLSQERNFAKITKDLFWKFDLECREKEYQSGHTWGQWLKTHQEKSTEILNSFRESLRTRQTSLHQDLIRKNSVASLKEVEEKLIAQGLDSRTELEVRKSLLSLKREKLASTFTTLESKKGSSVVKSSENFHGNVLVTRGDLDRHLQSTLLTSFPLQGRRKSKSETIPSSNVQVQSSLGVILPVSVENLFLPDKSEVASKVLLSATERAEANASKVKEWRRSKIEKSSQVVAGKKMIQDANELQDQIRRKKSEQAFRQWLRLRNKKKYLSLKQGEPMALPSSETRRPSLSLHPQPWRHLKESPVPTSFLDHQYY